MIGAIFKLNFISGDFGMVDISEPVGFDSADFVVQQESKRYARDISFSGGESEFEFYRMGNHAFEQLMYQYETYGFEAEVKLIITINESDIIVGDLDFQTAVTDQLEYFRCKILQDTNVQIIKRRKDTKVDLFTNEDLDGNEIEPVAFENILLKAKPIRQLSVLEISDVFNFEEQESGIRGSETWYMNPYQVLLQSEIEDTFIPFRTHDRGNIFRIIKAQNNLRDLRIDIENVNYSVLCQNQGGANGSVYYELAVWYGAQVNDDTAPTDSKHVFFSGEAKIDEFKTVTGDFTFTIPFLNRGDAVYIAYRARINKESILGSIIKTTTISDGRIRLSTISTSYNTIVPSIRLRDAVAQNVKSISGLEISFPFAEPNGEYYNQRIFNGNLLRNITNKPFYLSLKNIEDYLPEFNGDYEIGSDGVIYFGLEADFYKDVEIARLGDVQFDEFEKVFNERFTINEFKYKYKKYQSQKENETENTGDSIHGESEWLLSNKFVENKKDIAIDFVRDAFSIEEQRRKAIEVSETTATQDDDTIYIIDVNPEVDDIVYQETAQLQHNWDSITGNIRLNNDSSFSFELLGIVPGSTFKILGSDINAGTYTVVESSARYVLLDPATPKNSAGDGVRGTGFEYVVLASTISGGVSWSNEGFTLIDGISEELNYANMKYSVKRNVVRFWNSYLATCNIFRKLPIKNTFYKNNPGAVFTYNGLTTIEGDPFTPRNPLLSAYIFKMVAIVDYPTFKEIENKIRTDRGYIRMFDANGHPIKVFPQKMTFTAEESKLEIIGEEKFVSSYINIVNGGQGYLSINDEIFTRKIIFREDGQKINIFDEDGLLLFNPIFWQKISINGNTPTTKGELIGWLELLS